MDRYKEIQKEFGSGVRDYLKQFLNEDLIKQFIENKNEIFPFLIKNGMKSTELEMASQKGPDELMTLLVSFANNQRKKLPITKQEILNILENHPLIKLKEKPSRVFLIGSFATGTDHADSDIDILLEVRKKSISSLDLDEKYRQKLKQYFVKNNIQGKEDSIHPQILNRRIDVYFTYDADLESRDKIELE